MDPRLGCRCNYPYSEYAVWLLLPLQHACVCEPFWYCKHGSTSRCLGRWGWWVFLPASAGWAGSLPETSSPCSVKIPIWSWKKYHESPQALARKTKKKGDKLVFYVIRFRPCSDIRGQWLPVLHPPSPCLLFFSVTGMRSCPDFHNEAAPCCIQRSS